MLLTYLIRRTDHDGLAERLRRKTMNNNIKKIFVLTMALAATFALCARPGPGGGFGGPRGGGRGPAPMRHGPGPMHHGHHHHHAGRGLAIGAGVLGAGLLAGAIVDAARPRPVVVERPPVFAPPPPAPVVVTPAPVVTPGHYETRVHNVWVEGRYIDQVTPQGAVVRVWQPGHYEQQTTQVWVP